MKRFFTARAAFAVMLCGSLSSAAAAPVQTVMRGPGWQYWRLGNPVEITTHTTPGIVFEGGGTDVDAAYQWMCTKSGGGDFLVIRASGDDAYNPYITRLCPGINSVSTLLISSQTGSQQTFVRDTILKAEALFIAGGNQADYVRYWEGTPVNTAVNQLAMNGVPIGGTSAGNAILAEFAYSALHNSVTSEEALANPYNFRITIEQGFLNLSPLLLSTITDDHFVTRDRMGRLVTFLARMVQDGATAAAKGIATDEETAYLLEADGSGTVVGKGAAYFLKTTGAPETCVPRTALTYRGISVNKINPGGTFHITSWSGTGGVAYSLSAVAGVLQSTQIGGFIY